MAYTTYLLKAGGVEIPISPYIQLSTYDVTPNQRLETAAERDTSGVLHRTSAANQPSKITFQTPMLTETQKNALMSILTTAYTTTAERKLSLEFYCPDTGDYKTEDVYIPDIKFSIFSIKNNSPLYNPITITFIGY